MILIVGFLIYVVYTIYIVIDSHKKPKEINNSFWYKEENKKPISKFEYWFFILVPYVNLFYWVDIDRLYDIYKD